MRGEEDLTSGGCRYIAKVEEEPDDQQVQTL